LGNAPSVLRAAWPVVDKAALTRVEVEIVVQVNGKIRGRFQAPAGLPQSELQARALADPAVQKHLEGKTVRKVVVVPDKLVNIAAQ
jgi:leucyl-tRNA synthetase